MRFYVIFEGLYLVTRRCVELFDAQFGQTVLNAAAFSACNNADIVAFLNRPSQGVPVAAVKTAKKIAPLSNDEFSIGHNAVNVKNKRRYAAKISENVFDGTRIFQVIFNCKFHIVFEFLDNYTAE